MALIDFDADLLPFFAAFAADEPYAQGAIDYPDRYDDTSEQRIIVMIDAMRAYLETLTRRDEIQRFHQAMSRILGEVAYNRIYSDLGASVVSNVAVTGSAGGETVGVDVTDPTGTTVVTAPAAMAASATLALVVIDINGLMPAEVEAYADGDKLGFRLTAAGEAAGSTFTLTGDYIALSGVRPGPFASAVRVAARRARDKGLDHYSKEIRANIMP